MDKNKLALPAAILIGSIILGGFYYASEASNRATTERQQQAAMQAQQTQQQVSLQAQQAASSTSSLPKAQLSSLASQAQCAAQAQKALTDFEQSFESGGYDSFSQQNHYNPNFNECFEIISYSPIIVPGTSIKTVEDAFAHPTELDKFMDAYENNDLADCIFYDNLWGVDPQSISNPDSYIKCTIGNNSVTYQQLQDYVNQRMATGTVQF